MKSGIKVSSQPQGRPRNVRLRRTVYIIASRLLDNNGRYTLPGFYELGHCLILLDKQDEALIAYEQHQRVFYSLHRGYGLGNACNHDWIGIYKLVNMHHWCGHCYSEPGLFHQNGWKVCKGCNCTVLCSGCYVETTHGCFKHGFLEIPKPKLHAADKNLVNDSRETVVEWLMRIRNTFDSSVHEEATVVDDNRCLVPREDTGDYLLNNDESEKSEERIGVK
ncbi:uncharacterized protein GGS25DRAFT_383435 [Hypoxylon fragiforme]|uniref:uncharacterized protein n=1 Tax=Hypoxylon fragiforme TaxID=63214 RepID=UPI0020C6B297|nr:uncharacterized protein GGS25DRAFT_383435 [Hypoxylon fragiforme]KAI2606298.1 hypothetical protein GGS25DRAFT_383435 [Hypoxylon fragiforme]